MTISCIVMYTNTASRIRFGVISQNVVPSKVALATRSGQRRLSPLNPNKHTTISISRHNSTYKRHGKTNPEFEMPDRKPRLYIYTLMALNASVFLAWTASQRDHRLFVLLREKCLVSVESIKSHRYYTLLTSAFSHMEPFHLLGNMYTLYIFSSILWSCPGLKLGHFVILTLGSAITGSAGYVLEKSMQNSYQQPALGASGMVTGMGAAASLLVPHQPMLIMGVIPMPLWMLVAGYAIADGYYLSSKSKTAHSGHLGGLAWGSAYYFLSLYRFGGIGSFLQKGLRR